MVALFVVGVEAQWHEVTELCCEPQIKGIWSGTNEVARDENIQNTSDEGHLLASCHHSGVAPFSTQPINRRFHACTILFELLVRCGYSFPPFLHRAIFGVHTACLDALLVAFNLFFLCGNGVLPLFKSLWESQVAQEVEHCEFVQRWIGLPVFVVGTGTCEGDIPREQVGCRWGRIATT